VRLEIDRTRCQGHGRCYALAPDLFEPDDLGYSVVTGKGISAVPEDRVAVARKAVDACPERAVRARSSPRRTGVSA
jgi:ferredoxin